MSARLRFEPSGVEVEAAPDERVLDAADEQPRVGLPLACRAGNCGACLVTVCEGAAWLAPPADRECETLRGLGARSGQRLACQLQLAASDFGARIVLRVEAARGR